MSTITISAVTVGRVCVAIFVILIAWYGASLRRKQDTDKIDDRKGCMLLPLSNRSLSWIMLLTCLIILFVGILKYYGLHIVITDQIYRVFKFKLPF